MGKIPNRVDIAERPSVITERKRHGDWEADLIQGGAGGRFVLSVCERKSRVGNLYHLPDKSSAKTMKAILTVLHGHMVSSITYDNRFESAMHELVNDLLDCESYFCRPYHSWEKGWVDDYNRVVRQYFPKGYDFATITSARLLEVEEEINHRPRNISRLPVPERPP